MKCPPQDICPYKKRTKECPFLFVVFANQLIFKLDQDNLSEIVEKKIAKIGCILARVFTSILDMQLAHGGHVKYAN